MSTGVSSRGRASVIGTTAGRHIRSLASLPVSLAGRRAAAGSGRFGRADAAGRVTTTAGFGAGRLPLLTGRFVAFAEGAVRRGFLLSAALLLPAERRTAAFGLAAARLVFALFGRLGLVARFVALLLTFFLVVRLVGISSFSINAPPPTPVTPLSDPFRLTAAKDLAEVPKESREEHSVLH